MNRTDKEKQAKSIGADIRGLQRVCPLHKAPKMVLVGLSSVLEYSSPVIDPIDQRELNRALSEHPLEYYYVSMLKDCKLPKGFRGVYFKNNLTKNDPNTIQAIFNKDFNKWAYTIKFLEHDTNGFYFIVHESDIVKFLIAIRNEARLTKYQRENREYDYERLEDICGAYDIRNSYEYDKIFEILNDEERKLLFQYSKKSSITKENRDIIRNLTKTCKPFCLIIEELEEEIDRTKQALNSLETKDHEKVKYGIRRLKDRLWEAEHKLWDLTEEHNSETIPTELGDYEG